MNRSSAASRTPQGDRLSALLPPQAPPGLQRTPLFSRQAHPHRQGRWQYPSAGDPAVPWHRSVLYNSTYTGYFFYNTFDTEP